MSLQSFGLKVNGNFHPECSCPRSSIHKQDTYAGTVPRAAALDTKFLGLVLQAFQVTPVTIVGAQTLIGRVDGHRVQTGVRSSVPRLD